MFRHSPENWPSFRSLWHTFAGASAENFQADWLGVSKRSLFIIGPARSGTTVLQNALNASPEIYLFNEANFHRNSGGDFATRYNTSQRSLGNQETKGAHCPPLLDPGADWRAYVRRLAESFRYVGDKVVLGPPEGVADANTLRTFFARHFYDATFVFALRDPIAVGASMQNFWRYRNLPLPSARAILCSYCAVLSLCLYMMRNFPSVLCVFHEDEPTDAMARVGRALGVDLTDSASYFDRARVVRHALEDQTESEFHIWAAVSQLYEELRALARSGFPLLQLEQNAYNLADAHRTSVGSLSDGIDRLLGELAD